MRRFEQPRSFLRLQQIASIIGPLLLRTITFSGSEQKIQRLSESDNLCYFVIISMAKFCQQLPSQFCKIGLKSLLKSLLCYTYGFLQKGFVLDLLDLILLKIVMEGRAGQNANFKERFLASEFKVSQEKRFWKKKKGLLEKSMMENTQQAKILIFVGISTQNYLNNENTKAKVHHCARRQIFQKIDKTLFLLSSTCRRQDFFRQILHSEAQTNNLNMLMSLSKKACR